MACIYYVTFKNLSLIFILIYKILKLFNFHSKISLRFILFQIWVKMKQKINIKS